MPAIPVSWPEPCFKMLRAGLSLLAPGTFATALPAVQQCLGAAQQCWYATKASKAAPYEKDAQPKPPKAKKDKKDSTKQRTPSAYILFIKDRATAMKASGTAADMVKKLAAEWKAMTDADKALYMNEAAAIKSRIQQVGLGVCCTVVIGYEHSQFTCTGLVLHPCGTLGDTWPSQPGVVFTFYMPRGCGMAGLAF